MGTLECDEGRGFWFWCSVAHVSGGERGPFVGDPPGGRSGKGWFGGSRGLCPGGGCVPLELERRRQGGQWGLRPEWPRGGVQKGQQVGRNGEV